MSKKPSADKKAYKSYADIREDTKTLLRQNLIDVADYLMSTEGPEALTVRRIARELDSSTKVLYSLFGGKDGLANELYLEGSHRLQQFMDAVVDDKTLQDYVTASCWAYWNFAQENHSYYQVMFGNAIPQFEPDETTLRTIAGAFASFEQTLGHYHSNGQLTTDDLEVTIHVIWSSLHGVISLYQAKHFTETQAQARYTKVIEFIVNYLL